MKPKKFNKKMSSEELQGLLMMRRRAFFVPPKKGKGSFKRKSRNQIVY